MKYLLSRASLIMIPLVLLSACSQEQETAIVEAPAAVSSAYTEFNTQLTIRDVMNTLIDPNADVIWEAVGFEASLENGIVESKPETDAEWDALSKNAIAMIEGANSLMIPGRRVAPPGSTTDFPDAEYEPLEVEEKLREDSASWIGFAQAFQASTFEVLAAINARDLDAYTIAGGRVDDACTACHQQYWYRTELR
tara:strand:+ start:319 stop:903 length:585 start_codon:yes stop_codon:yes gene_type:complete